MNHHHIIAGQRHTFGATRYTCRCAAAYRDTARAPGLTQISSSTTLFKPPITLAQHHDRRRALIHLMQYAAISVVDNECYPRSRDRDAAVPGFDTVVNSAFYHVFQDDEGLQTRCAQTLHGATEPGARLFMFEFGNATTSTAFNGPACRPKAIVGGRRAQMRDGRSAGGDRVRSDHRNRRRGLNHGRMLLCHRQFDWRRGSIGPCGSCWSRSL